MIDFEEHCMRTFLNKRVLFRSCFFRTLSFWPLLELSDAKGFSFDVLHRFQVLRLEPQQVVGKVSFAIPCVFCAQ